MTAEQEIRSALEATTGTVQAQGYTVRFAEYASLLSELTSLREENERLREGLERCAPAEQSKSWLSIPLWQSTRALIQVSGK